MSTTPITVHFAVPDDQLFIQRTVAFFDTHLKGP